MQFTINRFLYCHHMRHPEKHFFYVRERVKLGYCLGSIWPHLQRQVGVLLFLANLQAGQVRVLQLQVVLLSEVLGYCALNCLAVLKLQRKPAESAYNRNLW